MEKDLVFFSTDNQGLTSTSANHIANLAKELIQKYEFELNSMHFHSVSVGLIGSAERSITQVGSTKELLDNMPKMLKSIAKAKSLIAWLREAIKAKNRLLDEINSFTAEDYCVLKGIEYPIMPVKQRELTEDEYYSSLSLKERNRYYELETKASVLGKAIHPDGAFSRVRRELTKVIQEPHKVTGSGRDTVIYSYIPTVDLQNVEDTFFELQNEHRETQAQLNSIKYACEQAINDSKTKTLADFNEAYNNWSREVKSIEAETRAYKHKKSEEISHYKIVIPDSLKDIFQQVSTLGK